MSLYMTLHKTLYLTLYITYLNVFTTKCNALGHWAPAKSCTEPVPSGLPENEVLSAFSQSEM